MTEGRQLDTRTPPARIVPPRPGSRARQPPPPPPSRRRALENALPATRPPADGSSESPHKHARAHTHRSSCFAAVLCLLCSRAPPPPPPPRGDSCSGRPIDHLVCVCGCWRARARARVYECGWRWESSHCGRHRPADQWVAGRPGRWSSRPTAADSTGWVLGWRGGRVVGGCGVVREMWARRLPGGPRQPRSLSEQLWSRHGSDSGALGRRPSRTRSRAGSVREGSQEQEPPAGPAGRARRPDRRRAPPPAGRPAGPPEDD